jgi:hypothetical protein
VWLGKKRWLGSSAAGEEEEVGASMTEEEEETGEEEEEDWYVSSKTGAAAEWLVAAHGVWGEEKETDIWIVEESMPRMDWQYWCSVEGYF